MAFFEALQNSNKSHNGDYGNGNIVLVKDGFCWPALFFTPFWLIFRGMWLVLTLYIGLSLMFIAIQDAGYISSAAAFWVQVGLALLFAFEANFLRRWTMMRGNYKHVGVSLGDNLQEAEVNFFSQFVDASEVTQQQVVEAVAVVKNSSELVVNPIAEQKTLHQKSHWKVGGKRKADSVVGMFNDD